MGIKERKERERDQRCELILNAAREIITTEGLDSLSIRKIANRIEYSPSVIYHYFQDKDDIINHLMKKSYQRILGALASAQASADEPAQKLREMTRNYINLALQMPDEYSTVMLGSSPGLLEHTSVLFKGASSKRPALGILCHCLKEIYKNIDDHLIELTAQVIWAATYGLIIRLIIEKDISEEQRINLIEHHINLIVEGMVLGKPLNNC